ncbi:MAG TPA: Uma2 family endonuclease [Oscillatoriaceae cyanobacterium M33_DOE_052]|uniref:Uma2 family endonuclease n=1 Tax=Planktothricoides sp. SpSt-374 TaxID=2282167 RepID=A0A7C3VG35_9CYAN|nr:Uma2 family endonuclease [Oscillatoriaceae cyanobacterium M33_DOE_052]
MLTAESTTNTTLNLRLWTVAEYHRMAELGIFPPDERLELINGQIIKKMSPQGTPHATGIRLLQIVLSNCLGEQALVQTQLPIKLHNYSEPEPDIAVVKNDVLLYLQHHPQPDEIYLLVEVADTTLKTDCTLKANEYAQAAIADYWVVDLNNRKLHVFRQPTATGYQNQQVLEPETMVSPLAFPHITIKVEQLLPPVMPF